MILPEFTHRGIVIATNSVLQARGGANRLFMRIPEDHAPPHAIVRYMHIKIDQSKTPAP